MPNKMLIDASHPEETRVVVLRGNRIEEFDFESQDKKQLRGNIYLARVTRVEPSLQAAFVEYGGNRHGFLAFSEIHPDYYQIPVADRQALLQAEAEQARAEEEDGDDGEAAGASKGGRKRRRAGTRRKNAKNGEAGADEGDNGEQAAMAASAANDSVSDERGAGNGTDDSDVDTVGAEDALDEAQNRRKPVRRNYKIQEVIKRRQILLVQVVKEERGNKGAALTTYLSLAGRYSVLMPNTARGGGISRKISSPQDRKRLKDVVRGLSVPEGMGVILRTAGANRTKAEIKRDYDYLMRLWEKVRNLTLESTAPALVYEEGSLIKRSVRDLYNKDIGEILVAGEEGYREAKDFMRMLMPSHAKSVQPYREATPIFAGNGIEAQLDRMLQPQVTLKSGGYIIINQTEALVAIDVNSGRSTKEHSIEDTALQTNLEAAEEVARQLRLRDLAGLIVIDFIDMDENRNNRSVEKRLKECLKNDRARIQVGRVSHFGLLEMSRQRIRASVLESTMQPCAHCGGTGHVRSESSVALFVARAIEEYLLKDARNDITVRTPTSTALYLLNHKRANLVELENRFAVSIAVEADDSVGAQHLSIVKRQPADKAAHDQPVATPALPESEEETATPAEANGDGEDSDGRKRKRKRRRRGGRNRNANGHDGQPEQYAHDDQEREERVQPAESASETAPAEAGASEADGGDRDESDSERKKRHRGKRGGRRNRREAANAEDGQAVDGEPVVEEAATRDVAAPAGNAPDAADAEPAEDGESRPKRRRARTASARRKTDADAAPDESASAPAAGENAGVNAEGAPDEKKPARKPRRKSAGKKEAAEADTVSQGETEPEKAGEDGADAPARKTARRRSGKAKTEAADTQADKTADKDAEKTSEPVVSSSEPEAAPRKTGWWQRKSFF